MNTLELFAKTGYVPHAGQLRFHESDARFKVLIAGARFGKSLAASHDILRDLICGESRGWLVGPTYALAQPEFQYLVSEAGARLGATHSIKVEGGRQKYSTIAFSSGAEVSCLSAHMPHTLLGQEVDWIILCEAAHLKRESFERFLRARLATREGRLLVPTTPHGHNWIQELYERGVEPNGTWASFRYASWDNPLLPAAEIEDARRHLPQEVFDEQYGGAFVARAGRVYREFERSVHVVENPAIPPGAVFMRGVDFGFTNPFACLWAALDGDDRLLVFDEYYSPGQTTDLHAREILRRDEALCARGFVRGHCWADPAGRSDREQLARYGVQNAPAENAVAAGINLVRQRLRPRADGTRGLIIDARCSNLVREFEAYCFEEGPVGLEAMPARHDDHALDALRYLCAGVAERAGWRKVDSLW